MTTVEEARRIVREAKAEEDARMRALLPAMSDEELRAVADECDSEQGPTHCWRCAAFALVTERELEDRQNSKGGLPRRRRVYNGPAVDLAPGDVLKHWPYPGNEHETNYVIVDDLNKLRLPSGTPAILATLRTTNTTDPPFTVIYPANMTISIWTDRIR